jgi:integrase
MERFALDHAPTMKPRAWARYRTSGKALLTHFDPETFLDEMDKAAWAGFVTARRKDGVTDATIRRDLACASSAFSLAVEWDWLEHNILRSLPKRHIKEAKPRVRWLREGEWAKLHNAAPLDLRPVLVVLVETGMRLGEVLGLQWRDVNLDRREVYLTATKGGRPRTVPLTADAIAAFKALPRHITAPHVLFARTGRPHAVTAMSKRIAGAIKRAGIADFRAHDLRHTFASWYMQRGGQIDRLREILGHARIEQTSKYAHLSTEHLHDDLAKVVGTNPAQQEGAADA